MHHDWIIRPHPFQDLARTAAIRHEILADDLEPIYRRAFFKYYFIMRAAQPYAVAQCGEFPCSTKAICLISPPARRLHQRDLAAPFGLSRIVLSQESDLSTWPPRCVHSLAVVLIQPLPLHEFFPLHEVASVAQAL